MEQKFVKEISNEKINLLIAKFEKWQRENIVITHGKREGTAAVTFGLAYTSSGAFAGLWNCNVIAHYKNCPEMDFVGITYDESGNCRAIFTVYDSKGNEVEDVSIVFE